MTAERVESLPNFRVGEVHIAVPGLIAEPVFDDRTGRQVKASNLEDPEMQSKIADILNNPKYEGLVSGIRSGARMAFSRFEFVKNDKGDLQTGIKITVVTLGTVAAAAAYEFGIRHGKDVREVIDVFKPKNPQK